MTEERRLQKRKAQKHYDLSEKGIATKERNKENAKRLHAERSLEYQERNRAKLKENSWRTQGITLTHIEYLEMFNKQNGQCAICEIGQDKSIKAFAVDHDHITGKVRGLLCSKCNLTIGNANDDINILKSAIKYLEERN